MAEKAVLLLNLGGPDSLGDIEPFLYNLFSDKDIIKLPLQKPMAKLISKLRAKKVKERYKKIGGKSPLNDITKKQAEALEKKLPRDYKVFIGMRYWHPTIEEAIQKIDKAGIKDIIVLPLFPQYSKATTGSAIKELERTLAKQSTNPTQVIIENWHNHPAYLEAQAEKIKEGLSSFEKNQTHIIFSAHALPQKLIDQGDPYQDQVKETINGIMKQLKDTPWHLGFQSQTGPIKWLEPKTEDLIKELVGKGIKNILIVPISFVSDNLETQYDIDICQKNLAEKEGATLKRSPTLNESPKFITALEKIIQEHKQ